MRWTTNEEIELQEQRKNGSSLAELAKHFNRTKKAITRKLEKLQAKPTINTQDIAKENAILKHQVEILSRKNQHNVDEYFGEVIRFGAIADTHLGSLYDNLLYLKLAYDVFRQEGINVVYHAGDLLDGEKIYRGQEYEIKAHGADAQIAYCISNYPQVDSIQTKFITGNHDLAFYKTSGIDVGKYIAKERPDMIYLGQEQADIVLKSSAGKATLRLYHPSGGTAYAISYKSQKYVEALTGGEKPNIAISGHFHKSEYLPGYRNVEVFQAGCIQTQTPFMARRPTAAMVGFWIIELVLNETGIIRCKGEFFPWFA